MTTYEITINENTVAGKHFLGFIKTLPFVAVSKSANKANKINKLDEAIEDIKKGQVFEIEDWEIFSEQMEKEAMNEI